MGEHCCYQREVGGKGEDKSPSCAASAFCVLACAPAQKHQNGNVLNLRFKWHLRTKSILLQTKQPVGQPLVQNELFSTTMRRACRLLLRSARGTPETGHFKHDWSSKQKLHLYTFDWLRFLFFPSLDMSGQVQASLDMFGGGYRNCPCLVIALRCCGTYPGLILPCLLLSEEE